MGKFDFVIPDGFIKQLGKLAEVDQYAPKMLEESAPILVRFTQASLKSATSSKATGRMAASVRPSKLCHNKGGWYMTVIPTGKDKKGVRNMDKAAYLEFGTSKQSARPWISSALNGAQSAVLEKMAEVFKREAGK